MLATPLAILALLAGSIPAEELPAAPQDRPVTLVLTLGLDLGSTKLVKVDFEDGSSQTLRANQGLYVSAGIGFLKLQVGQQAAVDTVATLGLKGWDVGGDNGSVTYLAFPVEVMERVSFGRVRVGAGISYAIRPEISSSGVLEGIEADLKNSLGFVGQVEWVGARAPGRAGWSVGARFVVQEFQGERGGGSVGANAFGMFLGADI